ncbi:MAG TPA: hypothetical protein VFW05_08310 [Verrucomicrobiae bacterium]|jgi:hypothetical protein|nr:hypothetical protein [Verrucomicrobiae bacterium]
MNLTALILCALALGLVALDVFVRVVVAPRRRDGFQRALLDLLIRPGTGSRVGAGFRRRKRRA